MSNLDAAGAEWTIVESGAWVANSFTTGSAGIDIANIVARFESAPNSAEMFIYDNSASNLPGTEVGDFQDSFMDLGTNKQYQFTPDGTISLAANTTYWMVFGGSYSEPYWSSTSAAETGAAGWSIGDTFWAGFGSSWTESTSDPSAMIFGIRAIPEPREYAFAIGLGLIAFVAFRRMQFAR